MRKVAVIMALLTAATTAAADKPLSGEAANRGVERLPITGIYKVTEVDGSVKYVSDNQRFVFVGKMYDLWQGEAMTAGVGASNKINLERNGVSIEKIAFPVGDALGERTLFIAPDCDDCRGLLRLALERDPHDLNIVLLASNAAGRRDNGFVWCSKNRLKGLKTVYLDRQQPKQEDMNTQCDRFGLMLAEQAALLFGIGQLPFYVDEDGTGHVGEGAIYAVSE